MPENYRREKSVSAKIHHFNASSTLLKSSAEMSWISISCHFKVFFIASTCKRFESFKIFEIQYKIEFLQLEIVLGNMSINVFYNLTIYTEDKQKYKVNTFLIVKNIYYLEETMLGKMSMQKQIICIWGHSWILFENLFRGVLERKAMDATCLSLVTFLCLSQTQLLGKDAIMKTLNFDHMPKHGVLSLSSNRLSF